MQPESQSNERAASGAHPSPLTPKRVADADHHPVLAALDAVAHAGQALAGARRQVEMANAEHDEASQRYAEAQLNAKKELEVYRREAGEPVLS